MSSGHRTVEEHMAATRRKQDSLLAATGYDIFSDGSCYGCEKWQRTTDFAQIVADAGRSGVGMRHSTYDPQDKSARRKKLPYNPHPAANYDQEKGAPWRVEAEQRIDLENARSKTDCFDKMTNLLARQTEDGVAAKGGVYGISEFQYLIQDAIRYEQYILGKGKSTETPARLSSKATTGGRLSDRGLIQFLYAARKFNTKKIIELLEIALPVPEEELLPMPRDMLERNRYAGFEWNSHDLRLGGGTGIMPKQEVNRRKKKKKKKKKAPAKGGH
jgi:hypothetical protein